MRESAERAGSRLDTVVRRDPILEIRSAYDAKDFARCASLCRPMLARPPRPINTGVAICYGKCLLQLDRRCDEALPFLRRAARQCPRDQEAELGGCADVPRRRPRVVGRVRGGRRGAARVCRRSPAVAGKRRRCSKPTQSWRRRTTGVADGRCTNRVAIARRSPFAGWMALRAGTAPTARRRLPSSTSRGWATPCSWRGGSRGSSPRPAEGLASTAAPLCAAGSKRPAASSSSDLCTGRCSAQTRVRSPSRASPSR